MVFTVSIGATFTSAALTASYPRVKALTVLFLALALLTVATLSLMSGMLQLVTDAFSGLLYLMIMILVI